MTDIGVDQLQTVIISLLWRLLLFVSLGHSHHLILAPNKLGLKQEGEILQPVSLPTSSQTSHSKSHIVDLHMMPFKVPSAVAVYSRSR